MKNYKAIYSFLLLSVFFVTTVSAQTMYIRQNDGANVSYDVNTVSKMTFSTGNMNVVKADNGIDVYALTNIQHVKFGEILLSAIHNVNSSNNELSVFPNPVIDWLNIKNPLSESATIVIFSLEGKQLMSKQLSAFENSNIDVSSLSKGFYLCKLYGGTKVQTTKFIKK
jgi:hypothetical protein